MKVLAVKHEGELTKEQQMEVVKQLAEFQDVPTVQKFIKDEYNKKIAYNSVKFYLKSKKWKPMLDRLRDEYVQPIMNIPVAHKFVRLERIEKLYNKTIDGNMKDCEKVRECRELLGEARAEIEGARSNKSGDLFLTQINNFSDEELKTKKDTILNRLKAIETSGNTK